MRIYFYFIRKSQRNHKIRTQIHYNSKLIKKRVRLDWQFWIFSLFFVNRQLSSYIKNCSNSNGRIFTLTVWHFEKSKKKDLHLVFVFHEKKMFVCILTFYIYAFPRGTYNMTFIYHSKTTGRFYLWHWIRPEQF